MVVVKKKTKKTVHKNHPVNMKKSEQKFKKN